MIEQGPRFWDTCYTNGFTACATFGGALYDGSNDQNAPFPWNQPTQFIGGWDQDSFTGSEPFFITAWGMKFPNPHAELNIFYADDAWSPVAPNDLGWTGFSMAWRVDPAQFPPGDGAYSLFDFAVGGSHYEGAAWQGYWTDGLVPSLAGTRFAWRGETLDHRIVFDCIQAGPGSTKCRSDAATFSITTTVTPEPSTLLLLLTGLALVQLFRRRYARRV